ncbi:MAG: DUF2207 domain-containing protein, partial [Candidatus Altiarchaeota archaeon]|nr:DUF2207 domain-containing protein [Candidatus Altiarchaeota archaeon]
QKLFLRFKNLTGLNQELKQKRVEVFDRKPKYLAFGTLIGTIVLFFLLPFVIAPSLELIHDMLAIMILGILMSITAINVLWIAVMAMLDNYVFGRYKQDSFKERLEWEAFARLLSDYSMIEKYKPADLKMWGRWLVYATVFGSADNVIKSMEKNRVKLANIGDPYRAFRVYSITSHGLTRAAAASAGRAGASFGGGIGGGFGGGGGGAR